VKRIEADRNAERDKRKRCDIIESTDESEELWSVKPNLMVQRKSGDESRRGSVRDDRDEEAKSRPEKRCAKSKTGSGRPRDKYDGEKEGRPGGV
jgi:hypothetical protein